LEKRKGGDSFCGKGDGPRIEIVARMAARRENLLVELTGQPTSCVASVVAGTLRACTAPKAMGVDFIGW